MFKAIHQELDPARDQAKEFLETHKDWATGHSWGANAGKFFGNMPVIAKLIREEPEILVFATFQWIIIGLAYLAWTQMLHWIPDEVWNAIRDASEKERKEITFVLVNLALLGWSFFVVCVASYPIAICTAAMVAVHHLRKSGESSTIAKCLAVATHHLGAIWTFTLVDNWITVSEILDRLPKKHGRHSAADELLYYAWKVATMGVVPALINGRGLLAAGKDSLTLLTSQPRRALGIRFGYSAACWVIGILSYVAALMVFAVFGEKGHGAHYIYNFYFLMAAPIFIAGGVISVLLRPFFLLSVAHLYTDVIDVTSEIGKGVATVPTWRNSLLSWKSLPFFLLLAVLLVAVFFADQIGLTAWVEHLAQKDFGRN